MKTHLFAIFLFVALFSISGVFPANAQTDLTGKYDYKDTTAEGNPMNSSLEIKDKNTLVFKYVSTADDYETQERQGIWTYDKAKKLLTVTLPADKTNQAKGDDLKQIYTFKLTGRNLKYVKSLYEDDLVGNVYRKL